MGPRGSMLMQDVVYMDCHPDGGPMLMQDVVYMDEMAHFDERIPERVVHAKGAGESRSNADL